MAAFPAWASTLTHRANAALAKVGPARCIPGYEPSEVFGACTAHVSTIDSIPSCLIDPQTRSSALGIMGPGRKRCADLTGHGMCSPLGLSAIPRPGRQSL